ncbi:putative bifunctional diguanylate cyclase/phosphodiesterase [Thalassolituus sp.]|uniref:putative bifunctional diguanylate cyclase/phosphodiesterase n=1 Tax=Thalassolituus sp. TaxID=2030822 RepID=UPI0035124841
MNVQNFFPAAMQDNGEFADKRTTLLMKRLLIGASLAVLFSIGVVSMIMLRVGLDYGYLIFASMVSYLLPLSIAWRYLRTPRERRQVEKARKSVFISMLCIVAGWSAIGMLILPLLDGDTRLIAVSMFVVVIYAHSVPFSTFPRMGMALMAVNLLPLSLELSLLGEYEVVAFGMCGFVLMAMEVGSFVWLYRADMRSLVKYRPAQTSEEPDMSVAGFRRRLLHRLHSTSTPSVMMQAVAAFFLVITLRVPEHEGMLWSWFLGYLSLQVLRTAGFVSYLNDPSRRRIRDWRLMFAAGVVANQLAWYSLLLLFHDIMSGFSLGVVSGMFIVIAVLSTVGLTSDRLLLYINSAMCLVPPVLILFAGEEVWSMVSLGMLASLSLLIVVENIHRSTIHSIRGRVLQKLTEYRAGEMQELNGELTEARERLTEVNASLESQIEERTQELNHQATHDMLTGLGNRYYFSRKVSDSLQGMRNSDSGFAVYLLDLDRFKEINDGLGHLAGDEVLKAIASRISDTCGSTRVCARWGGDEFVILEPRQVCEGAVEAFATTLVEVLRAPIELESGPVSLGASVGIAICPEHGTTAEQLLEHADIAVYRAKSRKTGVSVYDDQWGHEATERLQLVQALNHAIDHDEIDVALQPFVSVEDGSLTGFEALARWRDPLQDINVSPGVFIPLAEETGLMPALGRNILRKACYALMEAAGGTELRVAVNISVMQLQQGDFVAEVKDILRETGLSASRLEIELTESVFAANVERIREELCRLRDLGIRVSIDDFGTGYSSISYLRDFPLDTLKIDRSFVAGLRDGGESLFSSIVSLAHGLRLSVIVEGVENRGELEKVLDLGGEEIQGYYFARPIDACELQEWLKNHEKKPFNLRRRYLSVGS